MTKILWLGAPALVVLASVAGIACGGGAKSSGFSPTNLGSEAGLDGTIPPPGDGGPPIFGGDGSGDGSSCAVHCSSDLHDVVDCNNNVVTACPPDQGCANGGCVGACESANANKSTLGCEYYSVDPDVISEGAGDCFAAYIANTWTSPVTITVDRGGQSLNVSNFAVVPTGSGKSITYAPLTGGQLQPSQVAILFLAQDSTAGGTVTCPAGVSPAIAADGAAHGTTIGEAFHIKTSAPVVAYDIFPYGGGSAAITSATLLLPTSSWDTNYIAVNAFAQSVVAKFAGAQPSLDIVAQQDGTMVTILPIAAITGGTGVPAASANVPQMYGPLSKGQVLQFSQDAELTGSPIQTNFPVGVWGAASCLNIDVNTGYCDSAHQELPPVKALGYEYVAVRYRNRGDNGPEETPPWRLVGAVDGTTLTYEPTAPAGAPTTLSKGQLAQFNASGPFVVKSQDGQHPFYISGHMSGCATYFPDSDCRGDPEYVNVVPAAQYLSSYVFFTDPTYPETNLVVVRPKASDGTFKDVTLDCAGVLKGWQPADSSGKYQYTRIDLVRHDFAPQNGCDNGRHLMKSDAPFGLTVWGWGTAESVSLTSLAVSYAYPAGMSVAPINTVVVPPTPK